MNDPHRPYQDTENAVIQFWRREYPHLRLMPAEWDVIVETVAAKGESISIEDAIEQAFFAHARLGIRN